MSIELDNELEELKVATEKLTEHTRELVADWDKPLKLGWRDKHGMTEEECKEQGYTWVPDHRVIEEGIFWIPGPFKENFWSNARKKPKPTKCVCTTCGAKHMKKG